MAEEFETGKGRIKKPPRCVNSRERGQQPEQEEVNMKKITPLETLWQAAIVAAFGFVAAATALILMTGTV